MKYYSSIKRNELLIHATIWKKYKNTLLKKARYESVQTMTMFI